MIADSDNRAGVAHEGLLALSARDIASVLDVVSGKYPGDAYRVPPRLVVGGTYTDQAVLSNGKWRLEQRTLNITSTVITRAE